MTDMNSNTSGTIEFKRQPLASQMLIRDKSGSLVEAAADLEIRFDPLTDDSCKLFDFPREKIIRPDLSAYVNDSLALGCPFCQPIVEQITPKFPTPLIPDGNIRRGEALVFPNAKPYDVYSVVVVITREHFVGLTDFALETLVDALSAAHDYLMAVDKYDTEAVHHFIAWNYLPPSGGSMVHPHLQCNIGYYPTPRQKQLTEASDRYHQQNGANFWSDLIAQEKKLGQRYIGAVGATEWLTWFTPTGRLLDVCAVFPGKTSVKEINEADIRDFADGLLRVLGYFDRLNMPSFNLSSYSGWDAGRFWAHFRITPRSHLLYSPIETSDQFYYHILQNENICLMPPETACEELKEYF